MISSDMLEETLRDKGYRFCVSPDKARCRWMHPIEYKAHFSHWSDHTDTPEKEFIEFLSQNVESFVDSEVQ